MTTSDPTFRSLTEPAPLHPTCPGCDQPAQQHWIYVGTSWNPHAWIPGRWECETPGCRYSGIPAEVQRD